MGMMRLCSLTWFLVSFPLQEKRLPLRTRHPDHVACSNFPGPNLHPVLITQLVIGLRLPFVRLRRPWLQG